MSKNWIPEIMYEESDHGLSSHIPFIEVPQKEEMPKMLFIFESSQTGEYEPGYDGEPLPIVEMKLHQYADMEILKTGLTENIYNMVRECLGLDPLNLAVKSGIRITQNIRDNLKK
jgi:hypothetical protein